MPVNALEAERNLLGDFTLKPRFLLIAAFAVPIGLVSAALAYALLNLIALFTNIFFFQRLSFLQAGPGGNDLGLFILIVPVLGATIVGFMARFGSERIRGHGIPEAIEAILINGSRVEPKVAVLKPVSAAISIGSGGPFGAEGPIIMTAGSFGSLAAQLFHLTSAERKTLLVAGAAGGMSATFASPVAAVLLAVELLLFEWKPRSLIPVAVSSVTAFVGRQWLLGSGPLFPVPAHTANVSVEGILACALVGVIAGGLALTLTSMVYAAEDGFARLPLHWMWWPAIGGLAIGIGGLFFPRALGVGYDTIGELLTGELALKTMLGILVVKSLIWSISLGSGTSGGVLAPLLMMGAALGGIEAHVLPQEGAGYWPLISMAAVLGGTMRSPLTSVIFAIELTGDVNMLVPLLSAVIVAHGFTVLVMRRSILTEKISRRGLHLSREYAVDPLEFHFVRDVMEEPAHVLDADASAAEISAALASGQRAFPVTAGDGVVGLVTDLDIAASGFEPDLSLLALRSPPPIAYADEPLRVLAHRMALTRSTVMLVVDRADPGHVIGLVALHHLLKAYERNIVLEEKLERSLTLTVPRLRLRRA